MPIEIRELHIKATVKESADTAPTEAPAWFLPLEAADATPRTTDVPRAGEGEALFVPPPCASEGFDWL